MNNFEWTPTKEIDGVFYPDFGPITRGAKVLNFIKRMKNKWRKNVKKNS